MLEFSSNVQWVSTRSEDICYLEDGMARNLVYSRNTYKKCPTRIDSWDNRQRQAIRDVGVRDLTKELDLEQSKDGKRVSFQW